MFEELNGKRLLILGGSAWIDIIKSFAKKNGIVLVSVGNDPSSPLASLEEYYNIDSTDDEAMKHFICDKKIDGVYIGSNETVIRHAVNYVSELGLPCYCTCTQWDALMNKKVFKSLCRKFDIPVVDEYNIIPGEPFAFPFPVVTKPSDGSGSMGIMICNNQEEVLEGYRIALEKSPSHEVLIEKYVKNTGMDVFFQITNGDVEWCALGDKYPVQLEQGAGSVAGARVLPSIYSEEFRNRFENKLRNMFKYLNLKQGLIWMEVFHDKGDYYFNEVGYRPNGSLSIVGIDYLCGINTVAADMYFALTGKGIAHGFPSLILKSNIERKRKVCEFWVACNPGIIGSINGVNELLENRNVLAVFPKYRVGSNIPHTKGFAQNFCVIHFAYDNSDEMRDVINIIRKTIKVTDMNGVDMIIHKSDEFIEHLIHEDNSL